MREIVGQQLIRIETAGRHKPSQTPRSHSGDTESNAVAGAAFLALAFEEGDESLTHVAEANDAEVIGADSGALRGEVAVPTILNAGPSPERAALGGWEFLAAFQVPTSTPRASIQVGLVTELWGVGKLSPWISGGSDIIWS